MNDVMGTITEIISLIKYFPKRERMFGYIKDNIQSELQGDTEEEIGADLNKHCVTR